MSREARRVPMDFDWPLGAPWYGAICPYQGSPCPYCDRGWSVAAVLLKRAWYGEGLYAPSLDLTQDEWDWLVAEGVIHRPRGWPATRPIPPREIVLANPEIWHQLVGGSNGWSALARRRLGDAGIECQRCGGKAVLWPSPEFAALADAWEPVPPPTGDGWQLWMDDTPTSPVFPTLRALAEWCAVNATTFGSARAGADAWEKMLADGLVFDQDAMGIWIG